MLKSGISLAALLLVTACGPVVINTEDSTEVAEQAAVERLMGMETCEDAQAASGTMVEELTPCRIALGDGQPSLVVTSAPMADGAEGRTGTLRVEVAGDAGASLQVIEETAYGAYTYPYAEDIDGDGTIDIMVPLLTGNVNTSYAVWLKGADGMFVRAGELGGVSIGRTTEGLIATSGRSSASEWETGYFRVTNGAFEEVAAVVNRPDPEPGEPPRTEPACEVIRIVEGMDPAPFCEILPTTPG